MFDLIVRGDLVLPDRVLAGGYLGISEGTIGAIGTSPAPPAKATVDAGGKLVFPGVVDGQVHAGSAAGIEGLGDASRAAAAGRGHDDRGHAVRRSPSGRHGRAPARQGRRDRASRRRRRRALRHRPQGSGRGRHPGARGRRGLRLQGIDLRIPPRPLPGIRHGRALRDIPGHRGDRAFGGVPQRGSVHRATPHRAVRARTSQHPGGARRKPPSPRGAHRERRRLRDRAGDRGALPHRAQLARARVRPRAPIPGGRGAGERGDARAVPRLRRGGRPSDGCAAQAEPTHPPGRGEGGAVGEDRRGRDRLRLLRPRRMAPLAQVRPRHLQERRGHPRPRDDLRRALYRHGERAGDARDPRGGAALRTPGAALRPLSPARAR